MLLAAYQAVLHVESGRDDIVVAVPAANRARPELGQVVGLDKTDYRVKDGGFEMRVRNGVAMKKPPMLKVVLPFKAGDTVTASVRVKLLDGFTADGERAGLYLTADGSRDFSAEKKRVNGKLEVQACTLSDEVLQLHDREMLEDLIRAATNQALERARQQAAEETSKMASAFGLPTGLGLPGLGS